MWIKICGMTSEQAVETALAQRADAIGFVFAPSVRALEPRRAAKLAQPARGRTPCVAVTLHPSQTLIDQILSEFDPDVLQTDAADLEQLRLPQSLGLLPVWRSDSRSAALSQADARPPSGVLPPRLLYEGARSGSGTPSDWSAAARLATATQLILAGGLSADNVAAAIDSVRPFGVDVSSGVESAPGQKSPPKIVEFIQAARAAFAGIQHECNRNRG